MGADEGLLYLNLDVPAVPDFHLSDLVPCLATDVGYVIVPLGAGMGAKQLCCAVTSKSNSC